MLPNLITASAIQHYVVIVFTYEESTSKIAWGELLTVGKLG
jgi:hypothetical protein